MASFKFYFNPLIVMIKSTLYLVFIIFEKSCLKLQIIFYVEFLHFFYWALIDESVLHYFDSFLEIDANNVISCWPIKSLIWFAQAKRANVIACLLKLKIKLWILSLFISRHIFCLPSSKRHQDTYFHMKSDVLMNKSCNISMFRCYSSVLQGCTSQSLAST